MIRNKYAQNFSCSEKFNEETDLPHAYGKISKLKYKIIENFKA